MSELWAKVKGYTVYAWKAVIALAVPIFLEALIHLVEALQGTLVENPVVQGVLGFILVFLKANGPKPE